MKISRNWLSDFVDFEDVTDERFEELITTRVAEVDDVHSVGIDLSKIRLAKVLETAPIPDKDKLKKVKLSTGDAEVEVVCGAANCREGLFVAYAPPGSSFSMQSKSGESQLINVAKRAVGGVESNGLLLSERELDIGTDNSGILEITESLLAEVASAQGQGGLKLTPGAALSDLIGLQDTVLEVDNKSLTHRPDLWSHFGFARELSALLGRPLKKQVDPWATDESLLATLGSGDQITKISIEEGCGCRRFLALNFDGVSTMPSPLWMRNRLHAVGAGVRNLLVDLSNYVMHDIGQPNHAYDRRLLSSDSFHVRRAKDGEKIVTLDEAELELSKDDIVITDGQKPVALGGIMGGMESSIADDTTSVVLESANFDPVLVRQTAKRFGLRTDALNRFEKSLSAYTSTTALFRFAELLTSIDSNAKVVGSVSDCFLEKPKAVSVPVKYSYIRERIGAEVEDERIDQILSSLGFNVEALSSGEGVLDIPYYRATRDVSIQDDIVEEVGRIFGYENVPEVAPKIVSKASNLNQSSQLRYEISDLLRGAGFSEISSYSFMSPKQSESLGYSLSDAIKVKNPVDSDLSMIRTSLVPGMCLAIEKNAKNSNAFSLFEFGSIYEQIEKKSERDNGAKQSHSLCLAYTSGSGQKAGAEKKAGTTLEPALEQGEAFYSLLSMFKRVVSLCSRKEISVERLSDKSGLKWVHPYRAANVLLDGKRIGVIAEVVKSVFDDVASRVVVAELDMDMLFEKAFSRTEPSKGVFSPISKYPDSFFEMSVVMPKREEFSSLKQVIQEHVDMSLLRNLEVVSVYQGEPLAEDQKSVSVKLFLGADDRTLSGDELQAIQDALMKGVDASKFELRS